MGVITENIDSRPYTGIRNVIGKVRVKTHDDAPWLDDFFNGSPKAEQVKGITRGNEYDVIRVEGYGDCEDITIIDDCGKEQSLGDFFFENVN